MTKGRTTLIKKYPPKDPPQQLQTHNLPTDDVETTNGTNQGGDLLFVNKLQTFPRRTKRVLKGNKRN